MNEQLWLKFSYVVLHVVTKVVHEIENHNAIRCGVIVETTALTIL